MKKTTPVLAAAATVLGGIGLTAAPAGAATYFGPSCVGATWQPAVNQVRTTSWNCWTRVYNSGTQLGPAVQPAPGVTATITTSVVITDWKTS